MRRLDLLERYALRLSDLLAELKEVAAFWKDHPPKPAGNALSGEMQPPVSGVDGYLVRRADAVLVKAQECSDLMGFKSINAEISRAKSTLKYIYSYEDVPNILTNLRTRFRDELTSSYFLHVQDHDGYGLTDPFGSQVARKFPKASYDLVEAGNCLVLRRPTATVFHLMRAMEVIVQRLAKRLGITNLDREWGKLLSDISKAVEAMPKGVKRDKWSEAHTHLYHVKQAWRNDTMHPRQTYSEAEAKAIYTAVGVFAQALARLV